MGDGSILPLFQADSGQFLNNCVFRHATMKALILPHALLRSGNLALEAEITIINYLDQISKSFAVRCLLPCSLHALRASSTTGDHTDFGPSAFFAKFDATCGWNIRSFIIPVSLSKHSVTH